MRRTPGTLPTSERKLARARSRRSPTAGLWSRVSQVFQVSRNLSPRQPSPAGPLPQHPLGQLQQPQPWRALGLLPPLQGHRPGPALGPAPPSRCRWRLRGVAKGCPSWRLRVGTGLARQDPHPGFGPAPACALQRFSLLLPRPASGGAAPGNGEGERSTDRKGPKKRKDGKK